MQGRQVEEHPRRHLPPPGPGLRRRRGVLHGLPRLHQVLRADRDLPPASGATPPPPPPQQQGRLDLVHLLHRPIAAPGLHRVLEGRHLRRRERQERRDRYALVTTVLEFTIIEGWGEGEGS